ncbi:class I SAM-dependent methyltransferase [Aliarcobacter thereius]|uniref:class I SAM-dependent methyltransferase n=1 Tax=Aliarcobacter thereius TaxID=544718 RepID=UPI0010FF3897|nr:class I SAM-dependent methyltransferase [Aliarcobacter thereius]TLT08736.1 class I SAM-dependent methyltransferase [Aliarcobacter thereius]
MTENTKHHLYHKNIPTRFINTDTIIEFDKFYSKERFRFIKENIDFNNTNILDIGANNGYFILEALDNGSVNAIAYEGNKDSQQEFKNYINKSNDNIKLYTEYYDFEKESVLGHFDITILLNVLHHLGDDFGDSNLSREKALKEIIRYLNSILKNTNILIFQLGFNWKGNINLPLFENGTKKELIDFITNNLNNEYKILKIGIAEKKCEGADIVYNELNEINIKRDDRLGEFLNRPLFIIRGALKGDL